MALVSILAKLGLDATGYNSGLKRAESTAQAAGSAMRKHLAQAFTVAAIGKLTHDVTKLAGKIKDSADQFGLTRQETQELMRVASDSGVSFEMLAQSINKVTRQRAMAAAGNKQSIESFEQLGIALDRVLNADVRSADIFYEIGRLLNGANLAQQGAAIRIFGDESTKLFAAMKGIQALGPMVILTDDQIEKIDRAGKVLSHAKDDLMSMAAGQFSDVIEDYHKTVSDFGGGGLAKVAAGPASAVAGLLNFLTSGFRKDGNKNEGRLDLAEGLARRDAQRASAAKAAAEADVLAASASKVVESMARRSSGGGISDPLAKIGGLYFGADAGARNVPRQQLDELRRLNGSVRRIEQAAAD